MKWKLFNENETHEILDEKNNIVVKWQGFDGLPSAERTAITIVKSHNLLQKIADMLKNDIYMVEAAAMFSGKIDKFENRINEYKNILHQIVTIDKGK